MDIVERLRTEPELTPATIWRGQHNVGSDYKDSHNEIERLREQAHYDYENGLKKDVEIDRLRDALRTIRDGARDVEELYAELFAEFKTEARSALQQKKVNDVK